MRDATSTPAGVDEYLSGVPAEQRKALEALRRTIHAAAPAATEAISYGIPTFKQDGNLVAFAAFRNHLSFFAGAVVNEKFAKELARFERTKGGIHFTPQEPIPAGVIKRIVKWRLAENEARAKRKGK